VARTVKRRVDERAIVVLQGEIPVPAIEAALTTGTSAGARVVLNLAPFVELRKEMLALANPLIVNEVEASALLGYAVDAHDGAVAAAEELAKGAASVVITLGGAGASWADDSGSGLVPAPPVGRVVDTTGAGDAFIGGLATMLAEGKNLPAAVRVAVEVGSVAVTRVGAQASYPSRHDIRQLSGVTEVAK
jgi:ribokinase